MDAWHGRFAEALVAALQGQQREAVERFAAIKLEDYGAYREQYGVVQGLRQALQVATDLRETMDRPERKETAAETLRRSYES